MPTSDRRLKPSAALLSAALGALLSTAPACGGSDGTTSPPVTDNNFQCSSGVSPSPAVTSTVVEAMPQDAFASECQAKHGVFEIQAHCGGLNNCRGMSYDTGTQTLTEHTCRATNTCAGYACVICG